MNIIIIAYIAFISLGLPDGLLGVAWPGIKDTFKVSIDSVGLILIFGTAGYMLSSFFSGYIVKKLGIGKLLAFSCFLTSITMLIYSITPFWPLFFIIPVMGGFGAGAIDAGLNTYIAQNHNERAMQWLHASFGIGITAGPIIMTYSIALTGRWQVGYQVVFILQLVLAILFLLTQKLWYSNNKNIEDLVESDHSVTTIISTITHIPSLLSMLMFLLYTGFELGLGLWTYTILTKSRGIDPQLAGIIAGSYWGMFTIGRISAGWYTKKVPLRRIITISLISAIIGVFLLLIDINPIVSVLGITLAGLSIAPIFPGLVSDTKFRVGREHEANTIGMQISAAGLGAAVVPSIAGILARVYGIEAIPLFLLITITLLFLLFIFLKRGTINDV
ncbi:MFS transporter [Thiospirochaeta perfilievii]|uniref:MFS transporter n=1 Tax=Thiospirochaeta perfilievii TaxID=252967 RepID=A0A5C1QG17_9SPIO|nr:MFS transporter [Thiospirochaeta perfilievii]